MKIIFAIPSWNRRDQLTLTVERLFAAAGKSETEVLVVVSDNCSDDSTKDSLEVLKSGFSGLYTTSLQEHTSLWVDAESAIGLALTLADEQDYIWWFGDDDDISEGAIDRVAEIAAQRRPYFISAGNAKLPPHTNTCVTASARNVACNIGYFLTLGFISSCVFSYELASTICEKKTFSINKFGDAFRHASSVLVESQGRDIVYADYSLVTWRKYENQYQSVQKRWGDDNSYLDIAGAMATIKSFQENGLLPAKLPAVFFRWWRGHVWDFLLMELTLLNQRSPGKVGDNVWESLYLIPGMLEDLELSKRLLVNMDLHRALFFGDKLSAQRAFRAYQQIETYKAGAFTPDLLRPY